MEISDIYNPDMRFCLLSAIANDDNISYTIDDERISVSISSAKNLEFNAFKDYFYEALNKVDSDFHYYYKSDKETQGQTFIDWKSSLPQDLYILLFKLNMIENTENRDGNQSCATSEPFCTNDVITFHVEANPGGSCENGPYYGCLAPYTARPPFWFHMRIRVAGGFTIRMTNSANVDIDYCCWGPFSDPVTPCPSQLTQAKYIDCGSSGSATENCNIPNSAQVGQYYILVITKYNQSTPTNISFQKVANSGSGETDCSILDPFLTANTPCYGESLMLEAEEIADATYTWTSPDNQTHGGRTWTRNNANLNMAGLYTCHVVSGTQSADETINVVVLPRVNADFTVPAQCIMGQPVQFTGTETTTPTGHNSQITARLWNFGDGGTSTAENPTHTYSQPGSYTVTYKVTITGGENGMCENTKTKTVTITNSMSATITGDNSVCQNESVTLQANAAGGSGSYHYSWKKNGNPVGGDSPTLTQIMTEAGTYLFTCDVSDGYSTVNPQFTVTVNELPSVNIEGPNHVNYGQSATLSVTPITGATYEWTPANLIASGQGTATVHTVGLESDVPITISLKITTAQGCENTGNIMISLGDQFYAIVEVTGESAICKNYTTSLKASASGGSGNYTYQWEPANLVQSGQGSDEVVTKELTSSTTFSCSVSDGIYNMTVNAIVTVWQVDNVDYTPTELSCNEYYWEAANETFSALGDYPRTFYNENGCEYTVTLHLNESNMKFTTYGQEPEQRTDICVNDDGYYIWSPSTATDSYAIYMEYEGYEYKDGHEFQGTTGCPRVEYNWLKMYSKPTVDAELYGDTLVETGVGYLPFVYEYIVQNLAGAGTEGDHPAEYSWEIFSYYDTPNHVEGTESESTWYYTLDENIKNKVNLYINARGNALLKCTITTICGTVETEKFIWTNGYKDIGYSVDENDYDNMVNIFPNPSNGELYIGCSELLSITPLTIRIYSYDGTLIDQFYSEANSSVTPYSMKDMANGMYMVNIVGKDFSVTKRFVLNR